MPHTAVASRIPPRPPLLHLPGTRVAVVLWVGMLLATTTGHLAALAAVALLAATEQSTATALAIGGTAALVANGFLVHDYGQLGWTGPADLARTAVLVLAALLGTEVHR